MIFKKYSKHIIFKILYLHYYPSQLDLQYQWVSMFSIRYNLVSLIQIVNVMCAILHPLRVSGDLLFFTANRIVNIKNSK